MHKSRLATFVIDCETQDLEAAARFWSEALGRAVSTTNDAGYLELATASEEPQLLVQKVPHPSRIHLDIETDDIQAGVGRLEKLGAPLAERKERWVVMRAPSGQRFCVVRVQREGFEKGAKTWS